MFIPASVPGSSKYGPNGLCNENIFSELDVPDTVKTSLADLGNFAVSKGTWSSYKTAKAWLAKCEACRGITFSWPMTVANVLVFVEWLVSVRKVKASTINVYLSGVRNAHIMKGLDPPVIRSEIVKLVLKGKHHKEISENATVDKVTRLPVTKAMLELLREEVKKLELVNADKLLVWAVMTLAWNGAFRINELLCKDETVFDPAFCLLAGEVVLTKNAAGNELLKVTVKCPKEDRKGKGAVIEVFEGRDQCCAVGAFKKWQKTAVLTRGSPLFRFKSGVPLTGRKLNSLLKCMLKDHICFSAGTVTAHSFRIGLASELAARGLSDDEIKQAGRWSSRVFEMYVKLPRVKRARVAKEICRL